jgi:hypothetical protein
LSEWNKVITIKKKQMETVKGTLDGTSSFDKNSLYLVDFSKIESVNDLVVIFAAMGISFSPTHPHFDAVSKFLNVENPIPINQIAQPKPTELKLPKLKKLD